MRMSVAEQRHGPPELAVQTRFRWINERIRELYRESGSADEVDFVCECPDERCFLNVRLSADEFDAVRSNDPWDVWDGAWLVAPEHGDGLRVAA